jgi:hypothetical protein
MASSKSRGFLELEQTQSDFDRLPDSLVVEILALASGYRVNDKIQAEADRFVTLRLVCRRFSDLVFQIQYVILDWYEANQTPESARQSGFMHFLQNTKGMLKGLFVYNNMRNWNPSAFLVRNVPFTPNLEDLRLRSCPLTGQEEESSAQVHSQQIFTSLSKLRKLSLVSISGVRLNFSRISRLGNVRFKHLKQLRILAASYQVALRLSDKDLAYLVEACPKLEILYTGSVSGSGLQDPVIKSTSIKSIYLNVHIQRTLTVDAPSLCYICIQGVPQGASIRSGGRPLFFDTYHEGDFGHIQLSDPASVESLTLTGRWEKVELTRLLKSCCKATHIRFNTWFRLKDGESKLDLLELLSHLSSLKVLRISELSMMEFGQGHGCTPSRKVGKSLWHLQLDLTEEGQKEMCTRLIDAVVDLRSLMLLGASKELEQSCYPTRRFCKSDTLILTSPYSNLRSFMARLGDSRCSISTSLSHFQHALSSLLRTEKPLAVVLEAKGIFNWCMGNIRALSR